MALPPESGYTYRRAPSRPGPVVELVDTADLKSASASRSAGSSPAGATSCFNGLAENVTFPQSLYRPRMCNSCVVVSGFFVLSSLRMFYNRSPFHTIEGEVDCSNLGVRVTMYH